MSQASSPARPPLRRRSAGGRRLALAAALVIGLLAPSSAFATNWDVFNAGTRYCADSYSGHPSWFRAANSGWVVDINFPGDSGQPLRAPENGSVAVASTGYGNGFGNSIVWTNGAGTEKLHMAHLATINKTGAVSAGDVIGTVGTTGASSGAHLHISRWVSGASAPVVLSGQTLSPAFPPDAQYGAWPCRSATYTSAGQAPPPPTGPIAGSPFGNVDGINGGSAGFIQVRGWTIDPNDRPRSLNIHVYRDGPAGTGTFVGSVTANLERPDVAAVHAGSGNAHGFAWAFPGIPPGSHSVYVYAINAGGTPGENPLIGSGTANVPGVVTGAPFGGFDLAEGKLGGKARIRGWTVDPDARTVSTNVHVYIDGPAGSGVRGINTGAADSGRPDVNRVFPGVGDYHGFDYTVDGLSPGYHSFWVYAINKAGGGDNPLIGVKTALVPVGAEPPPPVTPTPVTPTPPAVTPTTSPGTTSGGGSSSAGPRSSGPSLCKVPRLAGLTPTAAKTKLVRNGCKLGTITYVGRRNPRADKVIGVKRRVGIQLGRGAKVGIVVRR